MEVEIVKDFDRFLQWEDAWNSALLNSDTDSVFMRHEWFRCWWQAFGENCEMFVVIIKENNKVLGIAPLMLRTIKRKGIPFKALTFISDALSPRCNIILTDKYKETMKELVNILFNYSERYQFALLDNILEGAVATKELLGYFKNNRVNFIREEAWDSPFIKMEVGWDNYFKSLSSKHRYNLRRSKRLISEEGQLKTECIKDKKLLGSALERCFEISKRSWKGPLGTDLGGKETRARFFRELTKVGGTQDWVNIWFLGIGTEDMAFEYQLLYKGNVLLLASDYDLKYARFSPGEVLTSLYVEQLFKEKYEECDFSGTAYDYKLRWSNSVRKHIQLWIFNKRPSSKLFYLTKAKFLPSLRNLGNFIRKSEMTKDESALKPDN